MSHDRNHPDTLSLSLTTMTQPGLNLGWLSSTAVLDDGETDLLVRSSVVGLRPHLFYLPLMMR